MEHVSTVKENTWLLTYTSTIANWAEVVRTLLQSRLWRHLVNAFLLKAWEAFLLSSYSFAWMTTWKHLVARLLHQVKTFLLSTYVTESWFHTWWWLLQLVSAEPAAFRLVLCACLTSVVWFSVALSAEVLATSIASDSVVCHMSGWFITQWIALVIFLTPNYFSRDHLHDITAWARDKWWVFLNNLQLLIFFNWFLVFSIQILLELIVSNLDFTLRTINTLIFWHQFNWYLH